MATDVDIFNDDQMAELRSIFFSQSLEIVDAMEDGILALERNPGDEASLKSLLRSFHTLKGDSNSIGLTEVGSFVHKAEDVLSLLREHVVTAEGRVITVLLRAKDAIEMLLREAEVGREITPPSEAIALIDGFLGDALREKGDNVRTHPKGPRTVRAEISLHPLCAEREVAALMLREQCSRLGDVLETVPAIGGDITRMTNIGERILFVLRTDRSEDAIRSALTIPGITGSVSISEPEPDLPAGPADRQSDAAGRGRSQSETLRIDASRVDKLMNLVGELIIGRSAIDQLARDAEDRLSAHEVAARLSAVNAFLERTVSDLQKGVMHMRMVPVNQVFRKYPKIVRDVAAAQGKQVRLELVGKDTEIDKGIVDALGEPLMHMVRNSVDHGIESPEERRAAGKPAEGVVTLRAYREATQIVIEIADDGRGINAARLRSKAVEQGVLGADEAENLTEQQAFMLIFQSGLSTAATVSDISGRGVGMDAVKSAVENMKGRIEVHAEIGKGAMFQLRLPLTLAVIRAMLVEVGDKIFALPVDSVVEVSRITGDALTTIDGRDALLLRDRVVSLIRLSDLFRIESPATGKKFALHLNIGGRRIGLLVDRIRGQQELVLKAIDKQYADNGYLAGASILGDGKVVLILDTPAIVKKAISVERERVLNA